MGEENLQLIEPAEGMRQENLAFLDEFSAAASSLARAAASAPLA